MHPRYWKKILASVQLRDSPRKFISCSQVAMWLAWDRWAFWAVKLTDEHSQWCDGSEEREDLWLGSPTRCISPSSAAGIINWASFEFLRALVPRPTPPLPLTRSTHIPLVPSLVSCYFPSTSGIVHTYNTRFVQLGSNAAVCSWDIFRGDSTCISVVHWALLCYFFTKYCSCCHATCFLCWPSYCLPPLCPNLFQMQ